MKKAPAEALLWNFDYSQYLGVMKECAQRMKVNLTPYLTRHSGPSIDRSKNLRTQFEVQRRGHWKTTKSILRYEKSARLAKSWELVPKVTQDFCQECETVFEAIMSGRRSPPSSSRLAEIQKVAM